MRRRHTAAVIGSVLPVLAAASAAVAGPMVAPNVEGHFASTDGARLTVDIPGGVEGKLTFNGRTYPIQVPGDADRPGVLDASMSLPSNVLAFMEIKVDGTRLTLTSGNSVYHLARTGPAADPDVGVAAADGPANGGTAAAAGDVWKLPPDRVKQLAAGGDAAAMDRLGYMYQTGQTVPKDADRAVELYTRALAGGCVIAANDLGYCAEYGVGGPVDLPKAVDYFRRAADAGVVEAENNLAMLYEDGVGGLDKDLPQAFALYRKAAAGGERNALYAVGRFYNGGLGGVEKDEKRATTWYLKAADAGNGAGMNAVGYRYQTGTGGLGQDYARAMEWYLKAVDHNYPTACDNVAWMYSHGLGVDKDMVKAVEWDRRGAAAGVTGSMFNLGINLINGDGDQVPADPNQGREWIGKAAAAGNDDARQWLQAHGE